MSNKGNNISCFTFIGVMADVINCDGMMCTLDAFECKIEQITTKDLKEIETVKNCLSRKGKFQSCCQNECA